MTDATSNPLLQPWDTPYGLPPFAAIRPEHFAARLRGGDAPSTAPRSMRSAADPAARRPSTTRSPRSTAAAGCSTAIERLFYNLTVERDLAGAAGGRAARWRRGSPRTTTRSTCTRAVRAHRRAARAARRARPRRPSEVGCSSASTSTSRVAGARLGAAERSGATREIVERLAELTTPFGQNVLADEAALRARAARRARPRRPARLRARRGARRRRVERGIPTHGRSRCRARSSCRSSTFSDRRDLREQAYRAWTRAASTRARTTTGRSRARSSRCATSRRGCTATRATPTTRWSTGWPARRPPCPRCSSRCGQPAKAHAPRAERDALAALALSRGETSRRSSPGTGATTPRRCARSRYDLDEAQRQALFPARPDARGGVRLRAAACSASASSRSRSVAGLPPGRRVYEVRDADDALVGVFLRDNFARPTKRGGAWMSAYRRQSRIAPAASVCRSSSTTTTSRRRARRADAAVGSTTCARCSTSSATGCTACCRR